MASPPSAVARTATAALLLAGALALAPALSASAHSSVVDSTPAEGEVLTTLPEAFSLTANEELLDITGEASGFALQIIDADGLHYEQSCPVVDGVLLSTPAALGAAGDYELRYQFVSADGHGVSGSIAFAWAPAGEAPVTVGTESSLCGPAAPSETDVESTPPPGAVNDGGAGTTDPRLDTGLPVWAWVLIIGGVLAVAVVVVIVVVVRGARRR